jgi:hypothetical protein
MEGLTQMLIELAGSLIWPLEDFSCFAHGVHGRFLSFLHASQQCFVILLKSQLILVIIGVPTGVFFGKMGLSLCLGI